MANRQPLLSSQLLHLPFLAFVIAVSAFYLLDVPLASLLENTPLSLSEELQSDSVLPSIHPPLLATSKRADDYSCSVDNPCSNGACCGSFLGTDTGTCGYGPTYCGSDCTSNCNATAECGQYALSDSVYCPLNVCCSEWGFCGTASDFCNDNCQNNCVTDPSAPEGSNSDGVLTRVIGYYEAWSNSRSCHSFPPSYIPIGGLTHVNFAFAYIDPDTFDIATMESDTPTSLFLETADVATMSSGLLSDVQIFLSIGGWSFSDNDTLTQPIFSNIASSAANRLTFANNLVGFLKHYGFSGVDFDWEYPGAPDRGGKDEDTENYVLLLKTVREVFDSSDGTYGISFTAPSSYWYLRWFDLEGMIEYADWINLMAYDLHGVWDSTDPIGSIVQAHTNLTEIQQSVELFWRANVPPEKLVLGLGFYGRSFQLQDTTCATPGCAFSGAADAGTCTNNPGTLAYFEIMDIINTQSPEIIWDQEDAVKYFQYGSASDQWVSYDDNDTFAQKVEWANNLGLGGVMIWSVDQDTDNYDALISLVGEDISSGLKLTRASTSVSGNWASQNGQDCKMTDCMKESEVGSWGSGWALAPNGGAFKDNCGNSQHRYIICPTNAMPTTCQWRGGESGRACHGQCHTDEVTLFHTGHATVDCWSPGKQAFCCESNTWKDLVDSCSWSNDETCGSGTTLVAKRNVVTGFDSLHDENKWKSEALCCDSGFDACHWIGQGYCDDNECANYEIELLTDTYGDSKSTCGWSSRSKVLCCTPPQDLNPFLPVELSKIFPTLPPTTDTANFDLKNIKTLPSTSSSDTVTGAFGMVVIDGPSDVVLSLTKRDGSHVEFLDCDPVEKRDPQTTYTIRYICMDDSDQSNCDAIHERGAEGTIVRLPEGCGFASYGVVTDVRPSANATVDSALLKRAPPDPPVYEMDIKYDYSLVKRDSGDVYIRIDYGDVRTYWVDVVQGDPSTKRDLHEALAKRFYSSDPDDWKVIYSAIQQEDLPEGYDLSLEKSVYQLLYHQDETTTCGDEDGYMSMFLQGSVSSSIRFGFTMVGTISPELKLEESYGFFDAKMQMPGTFKLNGQASIHIDGTTKPVSIFSSDISNYGYTEPGIVSFSPKMNVDATITGQGTINADFIVGFQAGTNGYARSNAPLSLGDFTGEVADKVKANSFDGYIGGDLTTTTLSKRANGKVLFGLGLDLRTTMDVELYVMGSNQRQANAEFIIDVPHRFEILQDDDIMSLVSGDKQVGVEAFSTGISDEWEQDDSSHLVGSPGQADILYSGPSDGPDSRPPPSWGNNGIISGDYFSCTDNQTVRLTCYAPQNMSGWIDEWDVDPETNTIDGSYSEKRRRWIDEFGDLSQLDADLLEPRGTGKGRDFNVDTPSGAVFKIRSHTYPNGENGAYLLRVNPDAGYYNLNDPANCTDTSVTNAGPTQGVSYITEHEFELGSFSSFLQFMMSGIYTLPGGDVSTIPNDWLIDESFLGAGSLFQSPWNSFSTSTSTTSPMDDIWTAFGDTNNPTVFTNLQSRFNNVKMLVWNGKNPVADAKWAANGWDDTSVATGTTSANEALSVIRQVMAVQSYINEDRVADNMATVVNDIHTILEQFDEAVETSTGTPIDTARAFAAWYFHGQVPRIEDGIELWASRRLAEMRNVWEAVPLTSNVNSARFQQVQSVLNEIESLKTQLGTQYYHTSGIEFDPPVGK